MYINFDLYTEDFVIHIDMWTEILANFSLYNLSRIDALNKQNNPTNFNANSKRILSSKVASLLISLLCRRVSQQAQKPLSKHSHHRTGMYKTRTETVR